MRRNMTRPPARLALAGLLFVLFTAVALGLAAQRHSDVERSSMYDAAQMAALRRLAARAEQSLALPYALADLEFAAQIGRELRRQEPALEGLVIHLADGRSTTIGNAQKTTGTRHDAYSLTLPMVRRSAPSQSVLLGTQALTSITVEDPAGTLTVFASDPAELRSFEGPIDFVFPIVAAVLLLVALGLALHVRQRLLTLTEACLSLSSGRFHDLPTARGDDAISPGGAWDEIGWALGTLAEVRDVLAEQVDRVHERNADLLRDVTVYDDRLRRLATFASSLVAPLSERDVPRHALQALAEDTDATLALLLVPGDGPDGRWRCEAMVGVGPTDGSAHHEHIIETFVTAEHLDAEDLVLGPELEPDHPFMLAAKRQVPLRGVAVLPLRFRGRVEGLLVLCTRERWSRAELDFFEDAARPLAIALANRHAYAASVALAQMLEVRNDELVRQKSELEAMGRLRDQFTANISHELRTPLNAILGYTELLAEGCYGAIGAQQQEILQNIVESSDHLLRLVNQVLDLSKIDSGTLELEIERVDLFALVEQALLMAAPLCRDKPYVPRVTGDAVVLETDAARVQQVVLNLLGNAIKFTSGGEVVVHVSAHPGQGGGAEIQVRDTGIGIDRHHLELVFEEFRQVDGSSTRGFDGVGLGLAISRRLASALGGVLEIESEPGRGSTFTLRLPAAPGARAPLALVVPPPPERCPPPELPEQRTAASF